MGLSMVDIYVWGRKRVGLVVARNEILDQRLDYLGTPTMRGVDDGIFHFSPGVKLS